MTTSATLLLTPGAAATGEGAGEAAAAGEETGEAPAAGLAAGADGFSGSVALGAAVGAGACWTQAASRDPAAVAAERLRNWRRERLIANSLVVGSGFAHRPGAGPARGRVT